MSKMASGFFNLDNWHVKPGGGSHLLSGMDGIRGLAILLVVSAHSIPFLYMDTPVKRWLCVISSNGTLGVWLFFVLSGFLISLPFFKRLQRDEGQMLPPGYARRRAAKVIPPLYVSIVLLTLVMMRETHSWAPVKGALETMAFFQIFRMPDPLITPIYWTLAAEVSFYILLPFLFFCLRGPLQKNPWIIPFVFIGSSSLVWLAVAGHPEVVATYPFVRDVLLSFAFFGWGTSFSWFYLARGKTPIRSSGSYVLAGLVLFGLCCALSTQYWLWHRAYISGVFSRLLLTNAVGAAGFLMLFVTYESRALACRFFSIPLLAFAGLISYEWYLFHLLFIDCSDMITGSSLRGSYGKLAIRIFFAFPLAFVFSALFYRYFSLPILRWTHRSNR